MKFNFLQGDFSAGELSPRAQGHADSDAYKAGLRLASNCAPTRTGSIASRAGLEHILDGVDAHTGLPSNLPVQHLPIHDGPYGDFIIEVSPTGVRMSDKTGVLPWNFPPSSEFLQFTQQDGSFAFADSDAKAVYLRSELASGLRSYYLSKGTGTRNALIGGVSYVGAPTGTNDTWTLSGKLAGDPIVASVIQSTPANFQVIPIAVGDFSITFRPNIGGADQDFFIRLDTGVADSNTALWNLKLTKNAVVEIQDTVAIPAPSGGGTIAYLPPPTFGGVSVAPTQERIRAAAFWAQDDFWVALAGGPGNVYAGFGLRWHKDPLTPNLTKWTFGTLPFSPSSFAQIQGANTVAVYQNRLWYGINKLGAPVLRASVVGFGKPWKTLIPPTGSTGAPNVHGNSWLFQFIVETETFNSGAGVRNFTYLFPSEKPKAELIVTVSGKLVFESADWTVAGHTFDYEAPPDTGAPLTDQLVTPGGTISFNPAPGTGILDTDVVTITRVALADDPLDLALASPTGKIAWMNILRGLMLGTTRNEKLFSDGVPLFIDPATGSNFDLRDESSHGADPSLSALDVTDRVLFVQRGRRVLRLASISIVSNGGLVSEDVGVAGEHLTKARIRSMCFLKSPVPRVVFAFDDGTGAVMSLIGKGTAFSRFSIPSCFGGIYSVAALDSDLDSELWIGTENGVTLRARTFESDIETKLALVANAAPAAPTHLVYDADNALPPIMDSWVRAPLVNVGGAQYALGLPLSSVGQNAYAYVNGNVVGPYPVVAGGKVVFPANLALDTTWVDAAGKRRAQEVYIGLLYPEHRITSLPLEGGNPVGSSQNLTSRKPQLYLRLVDSYLPLVNGKSIAERGADDPTDLLGKRVTDDRRATEEGFQRGGVVDVVMDLPLRMEISAIFGGVVMNNI